MVRSIGVDPFKMVYFMEEEFGKVTMQNRVLNPTIERIVKAYIDHYAIKYRTLEGGVAMRQTHVAVDGNPVYGLTFVTGIVPEFNLPVPFIIYIPTASYPKGSFIILEDAINAVIGTFCSIFDEDLKLERSISITDLATSLDKVSSGKADEQDREVWYIFMQNVVITQLKHFFELMLGSTTYAHFRRVEDDVEEPLKMFATSFSIGLFKNKQYFAGELDLNAPIPKGRVVSDNGLHLTKTIESIPFVEIIVFASIRRLLRTLIPGLIDDQNSFDRKVTRRLLAQHLYDRFYQQADASLTNLFKWVTLKPSALIGESVDGMLRYMDLIDSESFQVLSLEEKLLEYSKLVRESTAELKKEESKNANSENGNDSNT